MIISSRKPTPVTSLSESLIHDALLESLRLSVGATRDEYIALTFHSLNLMKKLNVISTFTTWDAFRMMSIVYTKPGSDQEYTISFHC